MARVKSVRRKIRFYELVSSMKDPEIPDGESITRIEVSSAPWDHHAELARLEALPVEKQPGEPYEGTALYGRGGYAIKGEVHRAPSGSDRLDVIVLSKAVPAGNLGVVDTETGRHRLVAMSDPEGVAEETHVALLPNNVVMTLENGKRAPSRPDVERYLCNKLGIVSGKLVPIVPPLRRQALRQRDVEFFAVDARIPVGAGREIPPTQSERRKLRDLIQNFRAMVTEEVGEHINCDVKLSATVEASRTERDRLRTVATSLMSEEDAERLQVDIREVGEAQRTTVNLLNDILTVSEDVVLEPPPPDHPQARTLLLFRPSDTSRKMREAYGRHSQDLRSAVGALEAEQPFKRRRWVDEGDGTQPRPGIASDEGASASGEGEGDDGQT